MSVSILSYAGQVILGAVADANSVPRPRELVQAFEQLFEQFSASV